MRTWGGRFTDSPDQAAADFGGSIEVDRALAFDDLTGSIAHVRGLGGAGVLSAAEVDALVRGLEGLRTDIEAGRIEWDPALEDVHMNLEAALEERIGPLARKLHTGRSRNDQVATDLRLWLRRTIGQLDGGLAGLQAVLVGLARRHVDAVMPAHTHTQPAQPVLFAHHLLAHYEALERDRGRLADARRRLNVSPLGSGAIAGAGFPIDRQAVATELAFTDVSRNSIDAVGDRDFVVEALAAIALAMVHLSRLAEEIIWWSHPRLGFVRPAEAFSTGSSMLPNKRNPDSAELVRARSGRVIGQLAGMLSVLKGLPLGYQRDLQEDKPALFDACATLAASLAVMSGMIETLHVDEQRLAEAAGDGHATAVALADTLAESGVPFRSAHHVIGALVAHAEEQGVSLHELRDAAIADALRASDDEVARSLAADEALFERLRQSATLEAALARCDVIGGTAPARVRAELDEAARRLGLD